MLRNRIIPVLLLRGRGLIKTFKFCESKYVGDPINAVRIFNEKEVDELVFLDIDASKESRGPDFNLIEDIASECFMPLAYGGGVKNIDQMKKLFSLGVEKVILNSCLYHDVSLLTDAVEKFGSQSIVASIDVKYNFWGTPLVFNHVERTTLKLSPTDYAKNLELAGAGEMLLNSVDRDGMMTGYDHALIKTVAASVSVPVVACGGACSIQDMGSVINIAGASAAAAGSFFVFKGKHKAVLITYPTHAEIEAFVNIKQ
ncbi:MAG: hypothetical protein GQF41_0483 [Candidatus Rifleibacterium amylolyticum]|nr:MAG: hypothetical protein GQF41_0483 [Candidatus Rifleibacterium amylolyticum]